MKTRLMFADRDFRTAREPGAGEDDLITDLELNIVWEAMADGDKIVHESAVSAMLTGLATPEEILYRQCVLSDCLQHSPVVREIYRLALQAVAEERKVYRSSFNNRGETLLRRSITVLEIFVGVLRQLRRLAEDHGAQFASAGFARFFDTLRRELDDEYFDEVEQHLHHLRFRHGVLASARLGEGSQGIDYVLRTPRRENRGRFLFRRPAVKKPAYSRTISPRDEAGGQALSELRSRVLSLVADALGESTDHILSFFTALRTELGFYVGCMNLHDRLAADASTHCFPEPHRTGEPILSADGLYDPCLVLRTHQRVQGNDLHADHKPLIVITGANEGGKSTFVRSLGIAQLMMQAGMFVAAEAFSSAITRGVFTHYKREEDPTMSSGKFDEELGRMREIATRISTNCLLICNESFAATNEREGSEIASEVIRAMTDTGNTVVFVTHLYEFARRFSRDHAHTTLFLRADRGADGRRTFRLSEGAPLPTSYGEDLYQRTFSADRAEVTPR